MDHTKSMDDVGVVISRERLRNGRSDDETFVATPPRLFSGEKTDHFRHRIRTRSVGFSITH